jgi:protein-S-isoprenylcysteine O-methyltransferase Ste14
LNTEIIIIIVGSLGIAVFSWWVSIKDKRYHGIFRFFSFESIFILLMLNYGYWFINPFGIPQIVSWILLLASIIVAGVGFYLLKFVGSPAGKLENTKRMISVGLYKYIRHPLYLSLILLGFGTFFKHIEIAQVILAVINLASIVATAKVEENELKKRFGIEYKKYMERTKMFIPFLI